eukprot:CAMPEP_0198217434 /NCGR_PEP_ID=MMETSP1445-20131203/63646_1 /TAXON_ID=36898 /ORGANISM="Pyramimonas sp., Strain CCMP2087" /LENGTH=341 /DNA_ID=CAMNT_0043894125 /DNA_START=102 /DNA_END=1124 /DNA_ORIENTATION=-
MATIRISAPSVSFARKVPTCGLLTHRARAWSVPLGQLRSTKACGKPSRHARVLRNIVKADTNRSTSAQPSDELISSKRHEVQTTQALPVTPSTCERHPSRLMLAGAASLLATSFFMANAPSAVASEVQLLTLAYSSEQVFAAFKMLDYFGTAIFAITGTLTAAEHNMDLLGALTLAVITGLGGGTIRDVLLGRFPVFWLTSVEYLQICLVVSAVTFVVRKNKTAAFARMFNNPGHSLFERCMLWGDAVGLAAFAAIGAHTAAALGFHPLVVAVSAMMSGTFGGMIRDVITNTPPMIFTREVYASAAFAGGLAFTLAHRHYHCHAAAAIVTFIVTGLIRVLG